MAYPYEIGALFPTEGAFRTPGAYGEFLQAQASERASFLSEMEQFDRNLSETQRQFNKTLAFKEKTLAAEERMFGEELDWQKESFEKQLAQQWDIRQSELDFARQQLAQEGDIAAQEAGYRQGMLGLEREKLDLTRRELESERESELAQLDFLREAMGRYDPFGSTGTTFAQPQTQSLIETPRVEETPSETTYTSYAPYTSMSEYDFGAEEETSQDYTSESDWWGYY